MTEAHVNRHVPEPDRSWPALTPDFSHPILFRVLGNLLRYFPSTLPGFNADFFQYHPFSLFRNPWPSFDLLLNPILPILPLVAGPSTAPVPPSLSSTSAGRHAFKERFWMSKMPRFPHALKALAGFNGS